VSPIWVGKMLQGRRDWEGKKVVQKKIQQMAICRGGKYAFSFPGGLKFFKRCGQPFADPAKGGKVCVKIFQKGLKRMDRAIKGKKRVNSPEGGIRAPWKMGGDLKRQRVINGVAAVRSRIIFQHLGGKKSQGHKSLKESRSSQGGEGLKKEKGLLPTGGVVPREGLEVEENERLGKAKKKKKKKWGGAVGEGSAGRGCRTKKKSGRSLGQKLRGGGKRSWPVRKTPGAGMR